MAYAVPVMIAIAGVGSAIQTRNAGVLESHQLKAAARKEGDAARQREIERKRVLLRTLSDQSARAAAGGVAFEGSVRNLALRDIRDARNDLMADRANTAQRVSDLSWRAKNVRRQADLGAAVSLFDTAVKVGSTIPGKPDKKVA